MGPKRLVQVLDNCVKRGQIFRSTEEKIPHRAARRGISCGISIPGFSAQVSKRRRQAVVSKKFTQGTARQPSRATGWGLTIANVIVDHHKGNHVFKPRGRGTELTTLPPDPKRTAGAAIRHAGLPQLPFPRAE